MPQPVWMRFDAVKNVDDLLVLRAALLRSEIALSVTDELLPQFVHCRHVLLLVFFLFSAVLNKLLKELMKPR